MVEKVRILDLGCGEEKVNGSIGLDNVENNNVDIVHDLLHIPYPIKNNSYDIIYLRNVIEHFVLQDIEKIFHECNRILDNGGFLYVSVPHAFSLSAFSDITHKKYFTFMSGYLWDRKYQKSYYEEVKSCWILHDIKCNHITWFDWKGEQLKRVDKVLSSLLKNRINKALKKINQPSLADRIIGKYTIQFAEILWILKKG